MLQRGHAAVLWSSCLLVDAFPLGATQGAILALDPFVGLGDGPSRAHAVVESCRAALLLLDTRRRTTSGPQEDKKRTTGGEEQDNKSRRRGQEEEKTKDNRSGDWLAAAASWCHQG